VTSFPPQVYPADGRAANSHLGQSGRNWDHAKLFATSRSYQLHFVFNDASFSFKVNDGTAASEVAVVLLRVLSVDDVPVAGLTRCPRPQVVNAPN
jgi:hypothetical protein